MKENKKILRDSRNENLEAIHGEAQTPLLSSASMENEQTNVHKYMDYANGFFSFSRMENGSVPNRFYPTLDEAYRTTLTYWRDARRTKGSKNDIFRISDSMQNVLYEGTVTPSGRIVFSIYKGKEGKTVSTIENEINNLLTNKNTTNMIENSNITANAVNHNELKNSDMAETISGKAKIYLEKDILTQESLRFLCLTEDSAKSIAQSIQETAIANKDADNQSFTDAIDQTSGNMVRITKILASGKLIDDSHVSFHNDLLYCASHCKLKKSLFDGSYTWKKVPGKIAYNKVYESIMDMYHTGRKMLLESDTENKTVALSPVHVSAMGNRKSLAEVANSITAIIMLYLRPSADFLCYQSLKHATLDSELASFSNGIMSGAVSDDRIALKTLSGQSRELVPGDYPTEKLLRDAIETTVSQLFVGASISGKTRDMVSALIELASVEEYYMQTTVQAPAVTDAPAEKGNGEEMKSDSTQTDHYNSLVADGLCGIADAEPCTAPRDRQIFIRTFLRTCAAIAGLSPDTDMSVLTRLISDPFYKELVMDYLNGPVQPQYLQAA